jgi:electron transfer flavoprotein alpha subunit
MRIAVLVKQIPAIQDLSLDNNGRLARSGVPLEMNPHCRRAVAKGVELAAANGGTCTVVTMGPPQARQVLVEALEFGCDDAVLISDHAFAGSDTLATARALAAALAKCGPFDLILTGRNSLDSDTGQVGPQLAELAGLPFLAGVCELKLADGVVTARTERDNGWRESSAALPAVLSCAERLCAPAKRPDAVETAQLGSRIRVITAVELGGGPWGQAGSPTRVGRLRHLAHTRAGEIVTGPLDAQAARIADILASGATTAAAAATVAEGRRCSIAVLAEPDRPRLTRELLGEATRLGTGNVVVVLSGPHVPVDIAASWGADEAVIVTGDPVEEDLAAAVGDWCRSQPPRVLLGPATSWGREVTARIAARIDAGLVGDAVEFAMDGGGLVGRKPAAAGATLADVHVASAVQLATVRPGILPLLAARTPSPIPVATYAASTRSRVRHGRQHTDSGVDKLGAAQIVIGTGTGVDPADYPLLRELAAAAGAEVAATRKVTDLGWQPHSRQVGATGKAITPDVYLAIGLSGKTYHLVGVRRAGTIVAINNDPGAPIFSSADVGVVADWRIVARALIPRLALASSAADTA